MRRGQTGAASHPIAPVFVALSTVHRNETRVLAQAVALLLAASVTRAACALGHEPGPLAHEPSAADSLGAAVDSATSAAARRSRPLEAGERLDPNRATEESLDRLPGVGPAMASRIVAERADGGPFRSLDELTRVSGIGPATLAKLRPHLELGLDGLPGARPRGARRTAVRSLPQEGEGGPLVDLNRADAGELARLPGVGRVLAGRILEAREARGGGFSAVEELLDVPGIGPARLERIRGRVTLRR